MNAFAEISKVVPSKLLMIGDGPDRQMAEDLCRKLGTCGDVRFLGKQEKMEEIFNISDLFILPSEYESFGLAALEAMACGVPMVSSNTGGLPEINIEGVTGGLSDVGDVDDMVKKAIAILQDCEVLKGYKKRAFEHAQKFSMDRILPQYEALYTSVINEH